MKKCKKNRQYHQRSKDEYEQLRGKNRELTKEIKRLKRLKSRTLEQDHEMDSYSEEVMEDTPKGLKLQCPSCKGFETNVFEASHKSYLICMECPFRGPLK